MDHDALALAITDGFVKSSLGRDRSEETKCHHAHMLLGHVTPVICVAMCSKLDIVLTGLLDGSSRLCLEQESKPEVVWKVERDLFTKQICWCKAYANCLI